VNLPNRIKGANCTIHEGVCVVTKHTTDPHEFDALWRELGEPTVEERVEDGIPYLRASVDGVGWRVSLTLLARTLDDMWVDVA
jgi:hypothetical protein